MWLLFVAFVAVNDGVVVGDRSAHEVNFHPTQVMTDMFDFISLMLIFTCGDSLSHRSSSPLCGKS